MKESGKAEKGARTSGNQGPPCIPLKFRERLALAGFERALTGRQGNGQLHKTLFGALEEGVAIYRITGSAIQCRAKPQLLYSNPAFDLMTARDAAPPPGCTPADDFPCKGAQWPALLEKTARTGRTLHFETRCRLRKVWLSVTVLSPMTGLAAAVTTDVTRLRRAEADMRILMEGQGVAVDSPHIPYAAAPDLTIRFVGPQVRNYGYEPSELTGRPLLDLLAPQDRPAVKEAIEHALKTGNNSFSQFRLLEKSGRTIWFAGAAKVYNDADGETLGICGTVYNLSQTKEAEEKFQKAFQTATAATAIIVNSVFTEVNDSFTEMTGFSRTEVLGREAATAGIIDPQTIARATAELTESGSLKLFEAPFRRKDGRTGTALFSAALFTLGGRVAVLASAEDITRLKEAESRLKRSNHELETAVAQLRQQIDKAEALAGRAEAASQAKNRFLANMSHELRTPMNGVAGFLELLATTELSAKQKDYLEMARLSSGHMVELVNDLLDFAVIEAGRLELDWRPLSPEQMLEELRQFFVPQARLKGLELEFTKSTTLPPEVLGDLKRLRQVLINLLGNAIKFTDKGKVSLDAACRNHKDGRLELHFRVDDTGCGIPAEEQPELMRAFHKADDTSSRRHGGTGLGLAISRRLARLMEGDISLKSVQGTGSSFFFTAVVGRPEPAAQTEADAESSTPDEPLCGPGRKLRILHVEDDMISVRLIKLLLEPYGHAVDSVSSGAAALARLKTEKYDLVLMDIQMPGGMDGFQATFAIRQNETVPGKRLKIFGMTAQAMKADEEKCLSSGMDAYIPKPVSLKKILSLMARHFPET